MPKNRLYGSISDASASAMLNYDVLRLAIALLAQVATNRAAVVANDLSQLHVLRAVGPPTQQGRMTSYSQTVRTDLEPNSVQTPPTTGEVIPSRAQLRKITENPNGRSTLTNDQKTTSNKESVEDRSEDASILVVMDALQDPIPQIGKITDLIKSSLTSPPGMGSWSR